MAHSSPAGQSVVTLQQVTPIGQHPSLFEFVVAGGQHA